MTKKSKSFKVGRQRLSGYFYFLRLCKVKTLRSPGMPAHTSVLLSQQAEGGQGGTLHILLATERNLNQEF